MRHLSLQYLSTEVRRNPPLKPITELLQRRTKVDYHSDHLGSSSFISDAAGDATQFLTYLPFGEQWVDQQISYDSPYKFSGKELDAETGYNYFGARYYDSGLSLWLSVDPMSDKYPTLSSYIYVGQHPVGITDPDGADWYNNQEGKNNFIKNVNNNTNLKFSRPEPRPIKLFGLFNGLRRYLSRHVGRTRNSHTHNYVLVLKPHQIGWARWKEVKYQTQDDGKVFDYTTKNPYRISIHWNPPGSLPEGTRNGESLKFFRTINAKGIPSDESGKPIDGVAQSGIAGDNYRISFDETQDYRVRVVEKVYKTRLTIYLPKIQGI